MHKVNHIKLVSIIAIPFLAIGCAKTTPPVNIPTPPVKTESAIPNFTRVSTGIDATIQSNNDIAKKIEDQKKEIEKQKLVITETLDNAEVLLTILKKEPYSLGGEVDSVLNGLNTIKERNLFLEKQNDELEELRKRQEYILKSTKDDANATYLKLINKENETNELRTQNEFLSTNLTIKNDETESLKVLNAKKDKQLASANVYKYWVWGLIGMFILWTVIKNLLMMYNPMSRFRV